MDSGWVSGGSAAVFVPLIFWLLSRTKAFRYEAPENFNLPELTAKYRKWELGGVLFCVIVAPLFVWLSFLLLRGIAGLAYSFVPQGTYRLVLPDMAWMLPAILLGIMTTAIPYHFLFLRLLGPEKYAEYKVYERLKAGSLFGESNIGLNLEKFSTWLSAGIVMLVAIFLILGSDYSMVANDQGMRINRFFSFGAKTYPWSDVKEVANVISFRAPNGNPVRNPYYEVRLRDGSTWSTHSNFFDLRKEKEAELFAYIAKQSDKTMTMRNPFPNALPPKSN